LKRVTQGNTRILTIIMPNPTGYTDSIKNSQFKAAWQSGPTRTIRVPIALAEVTLEYARQLDRGVEPRDTSELSDNETSSDNFEPRDTQEKASNQADNSIDTLLAEPRDTGKMQAELEDARADYAKLLESSTHITNKLKEEMARLRSQLEQERADREEIEAELAELKQKSVTASVDLPEAADLLNQLKTRRKKSSATLADIEKILEIIEESQ
jgi:chromosome segregation ATPase